MSYYSEQFNHYVGNIVLLSCECLHPEVQAIKVCFKSQSRDTNELQAKKISGLKILQCTKTMLIMSTVKSSNQELYDL